MNRIELARTIDALAIESQRRLSPNLGEASLEIRARGLDSQGTALAVAAFTEALRRGKASFRTPHHDERASCIAAASAMAEGMMVISERAAFLSDYVNLLACYLGALQGRRVHALTSTASESESLNKSWVAVWSQLGITHERLVQRNTGTDGRRIYSNEIVLGGYEQFCDDYLADQFAKNITQWVGAAHDLAIVRNAGVVLPDMDRRLVQVSLPGSEGAVAGRIPGSDYLLLYRGVAALAPSVESWQSLPRRYDSLPTVLLAESERPIPPRESGSIPDLSGLATDLERMDREQAYQLRRETLLEEKDSRDIVLFQFDSLISHILETTPPARVNDKYRALLGPGNPTSLERNDEALTGPQIEALREDIRSAYKARMSEYSIDRVKEFEKRVLLTVVSVRWEAHLRRLTESYARVRDTSNRVSAIEDLSGLYADARRDLWVTIARDTVGYLFNAQP